MGVIYIPNAVLGVKYSSLYDVTGGLPATPAAGLSQLSWTEFRVTLMADNDEGAPGRSGMLGGG